jgi:serpin B
MARTLHFSLPQEKLHAAFGALSTRMNKVQHWNHVTLTTANSLWCQRDYPFANSFLNLVRADYDADAREVDFKNSAQAACGEINDWVQTRTKGYIKGIIEPGQITPQTRLILCNAIYFRGKWQTPFDAKYTKPAPFYLETNQTVTVPMMRQEDVFKMAPSDDNSLLMLELPYVGADLSMIILLPGTDVERSTLSELERKLSPENLRAWLDKLDQAGSEEIWVNLPRFKTTESFDLGNVLKGLGMSRAFSSSADFSGMEPTTNLFIADVFHKAFVEVDEAGTEASAAASVRASALAAYPRFNANHPFLFLIRDNGSGTILFMGRVVDPTK